MVSNFFQRFFYHWRSRIHLGSCPRDINYSVLVLFPFDPNIICCGLVGVIEFRRKKPSSQTSQVIEKIEALTEELKQEHLLSNQQGSETLDHHCLALQIQKRSSLIGQLQDLACQCRCFSLFDDLFINKRLRDELWKCSQNLKTLLEKEEKEREKKGILIPSHLLEKCNMEVIALKDIVWGIQNDCLENIRKVKDLLGNERDEISSSQLIQAFHKINFVLNNIDRLEVRGRDSAGISVMVIFPDPLALKTFLHELDKKGLSDQLKERQTICDQMNRHICCYGAAMTFTFKVSAEIGKLGDNVAALRKVISQDILFPLAVQASKTYISIIAHTRWASVGIISEGNCHPVNNDYAVKGESFGNIQVVLNGDIDNYGPLRTFWEEKHPGKISDRITTDTKIIPLQVEHYLSEGYDLSESFRRAVNDFEGSQAIAMQSDREPGKVFLALRGSGQSIFIGLGEDGYYPASELYGFIEGTSRFLKMDGEKERIPGDPKTQGQIVVLEADSEGELTGLTAKSYDGHPLYFSSKDIQSTEITTRDIDRRGFPHYFLKEITESPQSVKKTFLGKAEVIDEQGPSGIKSLVFNMGEEIIPERLKEALLNRRIRNIFMVGQGTAGIAAEGIAMLFREYLGSSGIAISEQKASELSGFSLNGDMSNTMVIAVTQSGTTTDTNKAVDMARKAGAYTVAIVNRRDSDITYKVDGVFYTSDGRDIEMSVASTKAFYSQIVAGCLLGLRCAQIMELRSDDYLIQEIKQLKRLPRLMTQILENTQEHIASSARKWGLLKRNWALVGSGPNKVAADEIRIKLSELCYKTLPSDVVEDRKHIDLSAEPLVMVCAAGSREMVLGDIIKDTAIFKAHKATTIVITNEGERRFQSCADSLIEIPKIQEHMSPILNTLVGHLWGYYAALCADEEAQFLKGGRQSINQKIGALETEGYNHLEIVFDRSFQDLVNDFSFSLQQKNTQGMYNAAIQPNTISDLILLLKYAGGKLPIIDLERDFQVERAVSNCIILLQKALNQAINELSRPIDAIKHQAKTVTVGTSRLSEAFTGHIFDLINDLGVPKERISATNLADLNRLQSVINSIKGYTLYEVNQLDHLGRPTDQSTISITDRGGISQGLVSRIEKDSRLKGRKRSIITSNTLFIGEGKLDKAKLLIIPYQGEAIHQKKLLLLHIEFEGQVHRKSKITALGAKYEDLIDALAELNISWHDEFLDFYSPVELFMQSEDVLVESIVSQCKQS